MATLITGGSGFVGLNVAERLLRAAEDVVLFGHVPPPPAAMADLSSLPGRMVVSVGDIRSSVDLDRAFGAVRVDRVVHAAAVTASLERERASPRTIMDVNLDGAIEAMEAMRRHKIKRILMASSVAVYGFPAPGADGTIEEAACCPAPATLYGVSKLAAEQTAARLATLHDLSLTIARIGPVFGPWEYHSGVRDVLSPHWQTLDLARSGGSVVLSRSSTGDWLYSRDAADALVALLEAQGLKHTVYNVGSGMAWSLDDWVIALGQSVSGFTHQPPSDQDGVATVRLQTAQDRAPLSIKRLLAETKFRPAFDLKASLKDYLVWLDGHLDFPRG